MVDDKGGKFLIKSYKFFFKKRTFLVPYWKLPKRAPSPIDFDINNNL